MRSDQKKKIVNNPFKTNMHYSPSYPCHNHHCKGFFGPTQLEERGHCLVPAEPGLASARPAYCQVRPRCLPPHHRPQECGGAAWPLLQTVYSCRTCGHTVHGSCLVNIRRPCVGAFLNRLPGDDEEEGFPVTFPSHSNTHQLILS